MRYTDLKAVADGGGVLIDDYDTLQWHAPVGRIALPHQRSAWGEATAETDEAGELRGPIRLWASCFSRCSGSSTTSHKIIVNAKPHRPMSMPIDR